MTHYEAGRLAAMSGCYRMIWLGSDAERAEWYRGYDDFIQFTITGLYAMSMSQYTQPNRLITEK